MTKIKIAILLSLALILSINSINAQVFDDNIYKLSRVLGLVKNYYVDTVNSDKLTEAAIVKMLQELDPHSVYISKEEVKEMNEPLQGNFEGVGIQFNILNDTLMVVASISGGPSEKVGIIAGDRIVSIDGIIVAGVGLKNKDVVTKLRGKKGTKVTVEILRKGNKELTEFTIIRDKIPIYSLDASYMIDDKVGYIRLNRFAATTMDEFNDAYKKLEEQGVKHLILDLTGNGGGYLKTAISLADNFLNDRKLVVYTEGINNPKYEYKATSKGNFEDGRVVILVDEGSASASEIVSGAIQDWDRGVIIGRRTFGKGLVQRPFELPDHSLIRLTVARYYTPTGRLIQKPYENGVDEYAKDFMNRYKSGQFAHADSIHFPDSLQYKTLVNKRTVYGGGGIMPDIFVPIDTTSYSDYYRDIIRKGVLNKHILSFIDNRRKDLKSTYTDFELFKQNFIVTDEMLEDLLKAADVEKIERNEEEFNKSKEQIRLQYKALVARDIWTVNEFFQIMNINDNEIQKALEVINDKSLYDNILKGK